MQKTYNILSLLHILNLDDDDDILQEFIGKYDRENGILSQRELKDMESLITNIGKERIDYFQGFFIGYKIPNIGKEFDLLKFVEDTVFNIELKNNSTIKEINDQQLNNLYYLKNVEKKKLIITYISSENQFYILNEDNETVSISTGEVVEFFRYTAVRKYMTNIDSLFDPSEFLISPFNSTKHFLESGYFLTNHQLKIKNKIFKEDKDVYIIQGVAGTGKSLVLYDLAKILIQQQKKVLIIHCGYLNHGHRTLKDSGWRIESPHKSWIWKDTELEGYEYILIDESHRFIPEQLKRIIDYSKKHGVIVVTTIDPNQYLHEKEDRYNNLDYLMNCSEKVGHYELRSKIRTNHEIADFIKSLFNLRNNVTRKLSGISAEYFSNKDDIKSYIDSLERRGWEFLPFTESKDEISYHRFSWLKPQTNSHRIIGQEFDKVVIILDESFIYKNGYLIFKGGYHYNPRQMLFQNLTRARKQIKLVIINNKELYKNILKIINGDLNYKLNKFNLTMPVGKKSLAKEFYKKLLGFEIVQNFNPKDGLGNIWFKVGQGQIRLQESETFNPNNELFPTISVNDISKFKESLLNKNIHIFNEKNGKNYKSFQCNDFFGNILEFIE